MKELKQEITSKGGSFYYEESGRRLAEMVYVMAGDKTLIIEHTDVDDSLKGQGMGKQLLGKLVAFVREKNLQVIPLCPFAKAALDKITEWQDVLVGHQPVTKPATT